jgi:FtsZ-binding cell division protein ZapB
LDTITALKLELKQLKDKLASEGTPQKRTTDRIIELKKEIKVLRRERDHYKAIVKENDLL